MRAMKEKIGPGFLLQRGVDHGLVKIRQPPGAICSSVIGSAPLRFQVSVAQVVVTYLKSEAYTSSAFSHIAFNSCDMSIIR